MEYMIGAARTREFVERDIAIPDPPVIPPALGRLFRRYRLVGVFLPALRPEECPGSMANMADWTCDGARKSEVVRTPLPGRWAAVEAIPKPLGAYEEARRPEDILMQDLDAQRQLRRKSRFGWSADEIDTEVLPAVATVLGLESSLVQLPTVEEASYVVEFFNWLREIHEERWLPDLGMGYPPGRGYDAWEWTRTKVSRDDNSVALTRRGGYRLSAAWRDASRREDPMYFRPIIYL